MRIERITAVDFQGIRRVDLSLGDLSFIFGPNGAGKSSIADAILFALAGETTRGSQLGQVVRQGGKSAEVQVEAGGRVVCRKRTLRSGEVLVDGAKQRAADADGAVEKAVGHSLPAVSAALRSGRVLSLKPAELQALLAGLTGARSDGAALREAAGSETIAALARLSLKVPTSLSGCEQLEAQAVALRQQAKRDVASADGELARYSLPTPELVQQAAKVSADELAQQLRDLRQRRDQAVRRQASGDGERAGRLAALRSRLAELAKVPSPEEDPEYRKAAVSGEDEELSRALSKLREKHATAQREHAEAKAEVTSASAAFEDISRRQKELDTADGCLEPCEHCSVADLAKQSSELDAELEQLNQRHMNALARLQSKAAAIDETSKEIRAAEGAHARVTQRRSLLDAARARFDTAKAERSRIESQIRQLESQADKSEQPSEDVEALGQELSQVEALLGVKRSLDERDRVEKRLAELRAREADADLVAKVFGPKGVRARLLSKAVDPLLDEANDALEQLGGGLRVGLDESLSWWVEAQRVRLSPEQLSDGEQTRLTFALQYAVTRLSGVGVLVLDRTELVHDRDALRQWAASCADEGLQVVLLTCAPAPEAVPAGFFAYRMEGGVAHRIPDQAAAANA